MNPGIHPTAVVDPQVELGKDVRIGPYSVVGPGVVLGDRVVLGAHVIVETRTRIGEQTEVYPFAVLGTAAQDRKDHGDDSELVIGEHTLIREHVTMHRGTKRGGGITRVGSHCTFMVGCHVAHDCQVGDHVILANGVALGGHVVVEDYAILGGMSAVHQFVRIGCGAMVGGMSGVDADVLPYAVVRGDRAKLMGVNHRGLKRRGIDRGEAQAVQEAYEQLFEVEDERVLSERAAGLSKSHSSLVAELIRFLGQPSQRGLCQP